MLQIVSVYDRKLGEYNGLFLVKTLEVAVRQFSDTVRQPNSQIAQHPEDFCLRKLGDFNEESGVLVPCSPSLVFEAVELVRVLESRQQSNGMAVPDGAGNSV